ncbi:MAG: proline--tRNA ligase [Candidatus Obscuribacter sp.]|nr:proline--tRNA ligase [Candidatus Obscuribacter sp.]MBP6592212.1 proline--tRNA ligase [Candidatus Obscuribacter sp.]
MAADAKALTDVKDAHLEIEGEEEDGGSQDKSRWYTDTVLNAELADYAPVKGCMVIRPYGYALWEHIKDALDAMIKETGHSNAYFPLLIPESFLKKEAQHVEGFAPELAVVTHGGNKKLEEPLVVRPTSETIINYMFAKWVQSWRDLPLLINQWANVVRWEMRTRLFLRTAEFLWQEGHTAHATEDEAEQEARTMLEVYRKLAEDWLALPVLTGEKTERERFAGAVRTYCIEAMMRDGKALQAGTSHFLGQNFAKAFDIKFQSQAGQLEYAWQTSWGVSTRLVGAVVLGHGDEKGLILPPKVAPIQVVIVPIYKSDAEKETVLSSAADLFKSLKAAGVRVHMDDRDNHTPGFKYNHWELRGVPVRIAIGPKDVAKNVVEIARRDNLEKMRDVPRDGIVETINNLLVTVQKAIFDRALAFRTENSIKVKTYDELKKTLNERNCFIETHFDGTSEDEGKIKDECKATIRCMPFNMEPVEGECMYTGRKTTRRVIFARSY